MPIVDRTWVKMNKGKREMKRAHDAKGFTLIEMMVVLAILGLLAAIAIPSYLRWQGQTRQAEAKTNLAGIFVSELAFFGENSRFGSFREVGFALAAASNRYTYRSPGDGGNSGAAGSGALATSSYIPAGIGTPMADGQGSGSIVAGGLISPPGFTATAAADLDNDLTIDQWHINDMKQNLAAPDMDDVNS